MLIKENIEKLLEGKEGKYSVGYFNLATKDFFIINDEKLISASLIKLFIYGTVCFQINTGKIKRTEKVSEWLDKMISKSCNRSTNALLNLLGDDCFEKVNDFCKKCGFNDTEINRKMLEDRSVENYTSVKDCMKLLHLTNKLEFIDPFTSNNLLDSLLRQQNLTKIPSVFFTQGGIFAANKTGELDDVENDVAIIYGKRDVILAIMSNDIKPTKARKTIKEITKLVCDQANLWRV